MQEQLPLRPAEFVKIRDGFIAFLKQPAGTPIEHVIPQDIIDVMAVSYTHLTLPTIYSV